MAREVARVYVNGILMCQDRDYTVVDEEVVWKEESAGFELRPEDDVRIEFEIKVEDAAVDQLANVVLPEEERKRRRTRRNLHRLFHAEVELGISSRGIKPK